MAAVMVREKLAGDAVVEALQRVWGFESLRPLQREVVDAALAGRDAVVVMPTGGGKSLCFQLPAVVENRLTVVVSPLIALMKDQVDALQVVGVSAAALNSSLEAEEEDEVRQLVASGGLQLLYVSPERLLQASTLALLRRAEVARFAIDEAHCISGWGHDFRPEYRQLRRIKDEFPGVSVMGFTATATPQVQRDIAIQLGLERPRKFVGGFDRPNLTYRVVAKDDPVRRIAEAVQRYPDDGVIVYCLSRKDTERVASALLAQRIEAVAYHAGLAPDVRKRISEDFAQERVHVVVATVAFGMGIDRSNVRCVVHECLPKSMEGYQQETGRAGRDGLPSECVLLYNNGDTQRLRRLLADGPPDFVAQNMRLLDEVHRFATSHTCRHKALSEHFGQPYEVPEDGCGACDVCLGGMKELENGAEVVRQILETVTSMLQLTRGFGASMLVGVLTGSRAKIILDRRGDQAAGFGVFSGVAKDRVTSWVHQTLDHGLLSVTDDGYPVVRMTEAGQQALADGVTVNLVENVALVEGNASKQKRSRSGGVSIEGMDEDLFEKLRLWRRKLAQERQVPAYVILHDATLMRIAAVRPSSVEGLRGIPGVGEKRCEEFGPDLVALVTAHAEAAGIALDASVGEDQLVRVKPEMTAKTLSYAPHFRAGQAVEDIAALAGITSGTVWQHLAVWVENERPASVRPWVDEETERRATEAIKKEQTERLKPVFEELGGEVPYEVLRVVRAFVS